MASAVADAASSMCTNDQTPLPPPTTGSWRLWTILSITPPWPMRVAGTVERAVPQRNALDVPADRHGGLEVPDRGHGLPRADGRVGVEAVLLGLDRPAGARVGPPGVALRHEPAGAGGPGRRQQVVRALGAQPVGRREVPVEVLQVGLSRHRGELVHDRPRAWPPTRRPSPASRSRASTHERLRPERADRVGCLSALRVVPTTSCPRLTSRGTSRLSDRLRSRPQPGFAWLSPLSGPATMSQVHYRAGIARGAWQDLWSRQT